jgi:DnaJ family protein C protein 13
LGCHRILEIVITLVKANKTAMSHLYKLGAFEILLWKLLAGDIVDWDKSRIAEFLSQSHLLQVISTVLFLKICFNQCFLSGRKEGHSCKGGKKKKQKDLMTMVNLQELTTTDNGSGQSEHGTWRDSILHLYLPEGLILNLMSEVFHTDPV